jgi:hypothetical protein
MHSPNFRSRTTGRRTTCRRADRRGPAGPRARAPAARALLQAPPSPDRATAAAGSAGRAATGDPGRGGRSRSDLRCALSPAPPAQRPAGRRVRELRRRHRLRRDLSRSIDVRIRARHRPGPLLARACAHAAGACSASALCGCSRHATAKAGEPLTTSGSEPPAVAAGLQNGPIRVMNGSKLSSHRLATSDETGHPVGHNLGNRPGQLRPD